MFAIIENPSEIENLPVLVGNLIWMSWNIFLALIGLGFGWLMLKYAKTRFKWVFFVAWLLFIPNSIYILTDILHFILQWPTADFWIKMGLLIQYLFLFSAGLIIYYYSFKLFEKVFRLSKLSKVRYLLVVIAFSILISFGVFMGRVQRSNSWYVVTQPIKIIQDTWNVISDFRLMIVTVLFGLAMVGFYFLCRDIDQNFNRKRKLDQPIRPKKQRSLNMINHLKQKPSGSKI
jgi:uncharacterized membrane protein